MGRDVYILAVETSCDETSAAIIKNGMDVISHIVSSQIDTHAMYGGVVPEIASRLHIELLTKIIDDTLKGADMAFMDIDAFAVASGPGLVGALLVGVSHIKGLAWALNKPLISVHHIEGHISANYLDGRAKPPFLCLVVSGGHSQIINVTNFGEYDLLGTTRDDAAGEAFDKGARILGLQYPGGVLIDRLSQKGDRDKYKFPRAKLGTDSLEFSFSGVKTALAQFMQKNPKLINTDINSIAASYQEAIVDALVTKVILATKRTGQKNVALAGGVAANSRLRDSLKVKLNEIDVNLVFPEKKYCTDNAAMIGAAAYHKFLNKDFAGLNLNASPSVIL